MGLGKVQTLRDHGEQRHDATVRGILREPPANAGLAVLQAGCTIAFHGTANCTAKRVRVIS